MFASTDGGSTWLRFGNNLPNTPVTSLELNRGLGILAGGTHGRGLWEIKLPGSGQGVTGTIFNDRNATGVQGATEPGLGGWTIWADDNNDEAINPGEVTTTSNAAGEYQLALSPGRHIIRDILQPGFFQTTPNALRPIDQGFYVVNVPQSVLVTGKNFGNTLPASLAGVVFNDPDGDGVHNAGEDGIAGRTVYLDLNNDGAFDPSTEFGTTTDAAGNYNFSGLYPGQYIVREVLPAGLFQTTPDGINPTVQGFFVTQARGGQNTRSGDFATSPPASISGSVFNDMNRNGVRDPGEPPLTNGHLFLDLNGNGVFNSNFDFDTVTDSVGNYSFAGLYPGKYSLGQILPSGYAQTRPPTPFYSVFARGGQDAPGNEFGNYTVPPPLTGNFFFDGNPPTLIVTTFPDPGMSGLRIQNLTTGDDVSPTNFTYVAPAVTAIYTLSTKLSTGNYRATLRRDGSVLDFYFQRGDINHDRRVDFADLLILAQNYGRSPATFDQGDLDYDQKVGFSDLLMLVQNYGQTLAPARKRYKSASRLGPCPPVPYC